MVYYFLLAESNFNITFTVSKRVLDNTSFPGCMAKNFENGVTQMVRTTMAIPIDIGGGQVAKINLPSGATLAGPVKVMTLPNKQTIAHVTVMAPPGVVEKYVAQAAAESEASGGSDILPKTIPPVPAITPAPVSPTKPTAPPSASEDSDPPSDAPPSSAPSNLFDKLSSKPAAPSEPEKPEPKPRGRPKIRSTSSESDNVPLSRLSSQKQDTKPVASKRKTPATKDTKAQEAKPQTGFQGFLEEQRPFLSQKNTNPTEKDITKEAKILWEKLDIKSKNHYIRNSDAYKVKKGIPIIEPVKNEKKASKSSKSDSILKDKTSSSQKAGTTLPKSEKKDETSSSGYNLPKRNVKRKFFDVEEDYDNNDADWEIPEENLKKPVKPLDAGIPSSMPPLKFKRKSRGGSDLPSIAMPKLNRVNKMAVNDDIDLPSILDLDEKSTIQASLPETKTQSLKSESKHVIKESTPPPPLRKIETVAPSERKANLKLICLHDGCFEEATTEPERGKYWCSDKCCIKYTKIIFNAWVGARRANMIE